MYIYGDHRIDERSKNLEIVREDGWGHIVGIQDGAPFVSHHPFFVHGEAGEEMLEFHAPKANPHLSAISDGEEKLVVFEGPQHYMSPKWCETKDALPTWIFVAVHVYGRPILIEDAAEIQAGLERLIDFNEARLGDPWSMDSVSQERLNRPMKAIVGFQMPIDRIESNFRLIQERPAADRKSVAAALSHLANPRAQGAAELIRRYDPDNRA